MYWRSDMLPDRPSLLPYGRGRSYGDVCLNNHGTVISTRRLNHFVSFDPIAGRIACEAGVTLGAILQLIVPHGWFLPTTPGTKFATLGGAIANDVHGKNHHRAGTFGRHVRQLELLRSDGSRLKCTARKNGDLYRATIGGLGLTGLITWAAIDLKPITSTSINAATIKMKNLDDFFSLSGQADQHSEYTVAWIDAGAKASKLGRGLFIHGNHSTDAHNVSHGVRQPKFTMRSNAPNWLLNRAVIRAYNFVHYHKQLRSTSQASLDYDQFFYPLDSIANWNRLYGQRGLQSYHCVVPQKNGRQAIEKLLSAVKKSRLVSPLTVLKIFGNKPSPGMLSFPMPGINLLLDFPNTGRRLRTLLADLDTITAHYGGRVNPAKDAHLDPQRFQQFYPQWQTFARFVDPKFSSSFWRRVTSPKQ